MLRSSCDNLHGVLGAAGLACLASPAILDVALKLWTEIHCLRLLGSASLGMAYVACGRLSLYCHRYLYPWDTASGLILIREAGGEIKNWSGGLADIHEQQIIAANKRLLAEFEDWLKDK